MAVFGVYFQFTSTALLRPDPTLSAVLRFHNVPTATHSYKSIRCDPWAGTNARPDIKTTVQAAGQSRRCELFVDYHYYYYVLFTAHCDYLMATQQQQSLLDVLITVNSN